MGWCCGGCLAVVCCFVYGGVGVHWCVLLVARRGVAWWVCIADSWLGGEVGVSCY